MLDFNVGCVLFCTETRMTASVLKQDPAKVHKIMIKEVANFNRTIQNVHIFGVSSFFKSTIWQSNSDELIFCCDLLNARSVLKDVVALWLWKRGLPETATLCVVLLKLAFSLTCRLMRRRRKRFFIHLTYLDYHCLPQDTILTECQCISGQIYLRCVVPTVSVRNQHSVGW